MADTPAYQNHGPFSGSINFRGRVILGTRKADHNFVNLPRSGRLEHSSLSRRVVGFRVQGFKEGMRTSTVCL